MNKTKDLKRIKKLAKKLGDVFYPLNKKYCSKGLCCCCRGCRSSVGYFNSNLVKTEWGKKQINELKRKYGWRYQSLVLESEGKYRGGFFEINKGCQLPREKRSWTCLHMICSSMNLNRKQHSVIWKMVDEMDKLRERWNLLR